MWILTLTIVTWNWFSSLTCRWRERVSQTDAWGGDRRASFWWEKWEKVMDEDSYLWCSFTQSTNKSGSVVERKVWHNLVSGFSAFYANVQPSWSKECVVVACIASDSSFNLHDAELWQLLWALLYTPCAPHAAEASVRAAGPPGAWLTQSIQLCKRDYIRSLTAADQPDISICLLSRNDIWKHCLTKSTVSFSM